MPVSDTSSQSTVSYAFALDREVQEFCRDLAERTEWVEEVFTDWPGPIAHEAYRLKEELAGGNLLGAVWQLKDVAEVMIKLPGVIMARDLLIHSGDSEVQAKINQGLFAKPLTLGDWFQLAGDQLARAVLAEETDLLFPQLALIFRKGPKKATPTYSFLKNICAWRNNTLGHGAFGLRAKSLQNTLKEYVPELNQAFQHMQDIGAWSGLELRVADQAGLRIHGAHSIHTLHDPQVMGPHLDRDLEVQAVKGEEILTVSPLLSLKRCSVCRRNDAFFFDSRKPQGSKQDLFHFLDYVSGHKMAKPGHLEPQLSKMSRRLEAPQEVPDQEQGLDRRSVQDLLDRTSLETRYTPPEFLRQRVSEFVENRDKGLFWLRGPAHCGKSVFVHGLKEKSLFPEVKVAACFFKREFRLRPSQFRGTLQEALEAKDCLDLQRGEAPELDLTDPDRPGAFCRWIEALLDRRPGDHLLICLDGLDELARTDEGSVLDFIPQPDQLPEGCTLLVTSRPLEECPAWVSQGMQEKLPSRDPDLLVWEFGLDNEEYTALLREYFFQQMQERLQEQLYTRLYRFAADNHHLGIRNDIQEANIHRPSLISLARSEWSRVVRELDLQDQEPGSQGPGPCQEAVNPVLQELEALFEQVRAKADARFLYVHHLCSLLRDRTIASEDITRLPESEELFNYYLDQLRERLPAKIWDLARNMLLLLAAAEEAFYRDLEIREASYQAWRGLPLSVLAELMGESGPYRASFLFLLYSLKEVLGTWRAEPESDPYFRLGLKDMAATIRETWLQELRQAHASLASSVYETWQGRFEEVEEDNGTQMRCLRYLLAHADLSGEQDLKNRIWSDTGLAVAYGDLAHNYLERALYTQAAEYFDQEIVIYKHALSYQVNEDMVHSLIYAYVNLGNALRGQGRQEEAVEDYSRAISLMEELKHLYQESGRDFPPAWENDLASAYVNRGNALGDQGRQEEAVEDYNRAISLREELKRLYQESERDFPPEWENSLAMAYMNRGNALGDQGRQEEAVEDYSRAISLMEDLKRLYRESGRDFPPAWGNSLAMAYMNRGNALRGQGRQDEAVEEQGRAISLHEGLKHLYQESGRDFPPEWENDLAKAYTSRGNAIGAQGRQEEAVEDYNRSISLREDLKRLYRESGRNFPPAWEIDLARAYTSRGNALRVQGRQDEAVEEQGRAISLHEELKRLYQESGRDFPPAWGNSLAMAYMNRGNALLGQGRQEEAIEDYSRAISLHEGLKRLYRESGMDFPPEWENDLASAYVNRGNAIGAQGRQEEAVEEQGRAISLLEGLQRIYHESGREFPLEWQYNLAEAYVNRGRVFVNQGHFEKGIADSNQAISMLGELQRIFHESGRGFSPEWQINLANAYMSRGSAVIFQGYLEQGVADSEHAIFMLEESQRIFHEFGREFPPEWQINLANAYMSRGSAVIFQGYLEQSAEYFNQAIFLLEESQRIFHESGREFPLEWQNKLANAYMCRGTALIMQDDPEQSAEYSNQAISILEELQRIFHESGREFPPLWQYSLGAVYGLKGIELYHQGVHEQSFLELNKANELVKELIQEGFVTAKYIFIYHLNYKLANFFDWLDNTEQNYPKRQKLLENTLITIAAILEQVRDDELCDLCREQVIPDFYHCLIQTEDINKFVITLKFSLKLSQDYFLLENEKDKYLEMRNMDLSYLKSFLDQADAEAKQELKSGVQSLIGEYENLGDTGFVQALQEVMSGNR